MVAMTPKTANLGRSAPIRAVVNFYGITDVNDQLQGPNRREYATTWVPAGPGRAELARRLSPITYVRKDLPPILTVHGDAEDSKPPLVMTLVEPPPPPLVDTVTEADFEAVLLPLSVTVSVTVYVPAAA